MLTGLALVVFGILPTIAMAAPTARPAITVLAAASMKNALDEANRAFSEQTGIKVTASYAASSALMKQIENGAPADALLCADVDWMDYGSQKKAHQQ